jgi:hypothetical protein
MPIARLSESTVLVVPVDSPHQTLSDFTAAWKKDPGALAIGGGSAGGTDHMLAGLAAKAVGIEPTRINYLPHSGGGESLASILGGHVAAGINGYAELVPFIEAGRLRALAIRRQRVAGWTFPVPGAGVEVFSVWRGVAAPPESPGGAGEAQRCWIECDLSRGRSPRAEQLVYLTGVNTKNSNRRRARRRGPPIRGPPGLSGTFHSGDSDSSSRGRAPTGSGSECARPRSRSLRREAFRSTRAGYDRTVALLSYLVAAGAHCKGLCF